MRAVTWLLSALATGVSAFWTGELQIEAPPLGVATDRLDAQDWADAVVTSTGGVGVGPAGHDWDDAAVDRKIAQEGNAQAQESESPGEPLTPDDYANGRRQAWSAAEHAATESAGLFEGDILGQVPDPGARQEPERNAIRNLALRWRGALVPYVISPRFDEHARAVIAAAVDELHMRSCVRFVPRTTQRDYLILAPDAGCSSHVGRVGHGQAVSLGEGCVHKGVVQHELMHALGFWHEQSRADRDRHVAVIWDNIVPGMAFNFQKVGVFKQQTLGVPYDPDSVTHYGRFAFSRGPGRPTLVARKPGQEFLGQQRGLSKNDAIKLNKLYECSKVQAPAPPIARPGPCADLYARCVRWAGEGECARATHFMAAFCARSCQVCQGQGGGQGQGQDS